MREVSKQTRKNGMRLFLPVVEYGLTEFAVSVQQIASRPSVNAVPLLSRELLRSSGPVNVVLIIALVQVQMRLAVTAPRSSWSVGPWSPIRDKTGCSSVESKIPPRVVRLSLRVP